MVRGGEAESLWGDWISRSLLNDRYPKAEASAATDFQLAQKRPQSPICFASNCVTRNVCSCLLPISWRKASAPWLLRSRTILGHLTWPAAGNPGVNAVRPRMRWTRRPQTLLSSGTVMSGDVISNTGRPPALGNLGK